MNGLLFLIVDCESESTNMDAITIVIKHSCLSMHSYSMDDVATLKCVSKEIKAELDEVYKSDVNKTQLITKTLENLGYVPNDKPLHSKTALKRELYLQYMIQLNRYYNRDTVKNKDDHGKLICFLNEFTLKNCMQVFTKFTDLTLDEQFNTVHELLSFTQNDDHSSSNPLAIYLIYYFINKLHNKNAYVFVKNRKKCILASREFRYICISKSNEVVFQYKNATTLFPYTFINKLIKLLQQTSRNLANM